MGGRRVSDDEKYDILFFDRNNVSHKRIADSMGIAESRVRYVIKRYKVEPTWFRKFLAMIGVDIDE